MLVTEKDLQVSKEEYLDFLKKIKSVRKSNIYGWTHPVAEVLVDYCDEKDIDRNGLRIRDFLYENLDF